MNQEEGKEGTLPWAPAFRGFPSNFKLVITLFVYDVASLTLPMHSFITD